MKSIKHLTMLLLISAATLTAEKNSKFENLTKPLDLFKVPSDVKQVMKKNELFELVGARGVKIRIAKEDFGNTVERYWSTYSGYNWPKASLSSSYRFGQSASAGTLSSHSKTFSADLGIAGDTGWGLSYSIGLPSISRTLTDAPTYNSESDTFSLGVSSLQFKLLNGSLFAIGRAAKDKEDLGMDQARHALKSTVLGAIQSAESAFYDVLLKQIRVQVLELGMASSQALLSDIKEMVAAGESDRLSILKTELQIAQSETDLLMARIELNNSRQSLRDLVAYKIDEKVDFYPDPNELKAVPVIPDLSPTNAIERGRKSRPDYLSAVINRRKAELDLKVAFSGTLPSLNLTFSYGYSGSGTTFTAAKDQALLFGPPTASVGLGFSYPLFNDSADSSYRQAQLTLRRSEVQVEEALNSMIKEISSAIIGVEMGQRRLKTADMSRQLSEKKLAAEFEKFRVGESKIKDVIDYQNEVNNARISEINSRVDFMKSLSSFRTAIGDLPDGVTLSFN